MKSTVRAICAALAMLFVFILILILLRPFLTGARILASVSIAFGLGGCALIGIALWRLYASIGVDDTRRARGMLIQGLFYTLVSVGWLYVRNRLFRG